ncbi:PIG-M-domain-containing protein [Kockovaella imperatae]|uniref:GPI mannosyltransferase 1 n=1 Tax=Kockovaella imperatae TaxID=4999 RepID=A0A1Y1UPL9_9TREE|nr:PIG-M-domain-containing protein [Kockovaella imperatae]ORX39963.1 PIG-M-domain-containing protein [Kockovaella imperatae]
MRFSSNLSILTLSLFIHLVLILYAHHVDSHPEQFGGLKYTDVDWRVVIDGARLIVNGGRRRGRSVDDGDPARAQGWIVDALNLKIGDPYARQTFRYTPLLPLVLSPALIHPLLGKAFLTLLSLSIPVVLLSRPSHCRPSKGLVHALWTLNPLVVNITTRGSPEAIIVLLVICTVSALVQNSVTTFKQRENPSSRWEKVAALLYASSISWKIYPVIYAPAIWAHLAKRHRGWFASEIWLFGTWTLFSMLVINLPLWSIWGQPFLDQTFLYHLSRLDHRHNFSPYYYPIYLSISESSMSTPTSSSILSALSAFSQHPLASFVPQMGLATFIGLYLTQKTSLEFAIFLQTVTFIAFNKVCTSQYFTWFIPLLPSVIPHLRLSARRTAVLLSAWVGGQALWLSTAYRLEFLAQSVHLQLWASGLVFFMINVWIIGSLVDSWAEADTRHVEPKQPKG